MHRADVITRTHQALGRAGLRLWLLWAALYHMPELLDVLEHSLRKHLILKFIWGETWKAKEDLISRV